MSLLKAVTYGILLAVLLTGVIGESYFLYCIVVGLIYIEAKDPNIRNLLLVVILVDLMFNELDYYVYYVSKYYLETGKVIGDIILTALTMFNTYVLIMSVYFRAEITSWYSNILNITTFVYRPTQADRWQLVMLKVLLAYHFVFTIILAHYAIQYYTASADFVKQEFYNTYSFAKDTHLLGYGILQDIRLYCVVLVLHGFFGQTYPIKKIFHKYF
jgi:hypothetical protein